MKSTKQVLCLVSTTLIILAAKVCTAAPVVVAGDLLNIGAANQLRTNNIWGPTYNSIAGGHNNTNYAEARSSIGGGANNWIATNHSGFSESSVIAGGVNNYLDGNYSVISGGYENKILYTNGLPDADGSQRNVTRNGVICGGSGNILYGFNSVIGGGLYNLVDAWVNFSVIAGGLSNKIAYGSGYSVISGGTENVIEEGAWWASIGGGQFNEIEGSADGSLTNGFFSHHGWIGGGLQNYIDKFGRFGSIGGGGGNLVEGDYGTIGGGANNVVAAWFGAVAGGQAAVIETNAIYGFIGAGYDNEIQTNASHGVIAGGRHNRIRMNAEYSALGGGYANEIGTGASYATIPGGGWSEANGDGSFAAGWRAKADHDGAFVWGDWSAADIASTNVNSVTMRASGGYRLYSDSGASQGTYLAPGSGSWTSMSDRNTKENVEPVNARAVLDKVATLPLSTWNYKSQTKGVRHIGPMAQDFKAAFGVGESETGITTVDADGVALAAIQGLYEMIRQKDTQLKELQRELKAIKEQLAK